MSRDEIIDLAAGYALGALEEEERARFETLLHINDPDAVAALRQFEGTLARLAFSVAETPPASIKVRLLERIAAENHGRPANAEGGSGSLPLPVPGRPRPLLWPALWAGLMAAGLGAIVTGLAISTAYQGRLTALSREAALLREDLARQQQLIGILHDPATQVLALAGLDPSPAARGRMLWNAARGGLFVATGLPPVPEGKAYQLWAITGRNPPVPAGLFGVDPQGAATLNVGPLAGVSRVDVFAVTLEPAGGLPAPSGPMYLANRP